MGKHSDTPSAKVHIADRIAAVNQEIEEVNTAMRAEANRGDRQALIQRRQGLVLKRERLLALRAHAGSSGDPLGFNPKIPNAM